MNGINPATDEVKKIAFEKVAQVRIYQLHLMAQVLDLAMTRGAVRGAEARQIGALFDTLATGVNRAFALAEEDIKKVSEIKLPSISEESDN